MKKKPLLSKLQRWLSHKMLQKIVKVETGYALALTIITHPLIALHLWAIPRPLVTHLTDFAHKEVFCNAFLGYMVKTIL